METSSKTSWRRLVNVLKAFWKRFGRRITNTSWRRLEDVLEDKKLLQWRRLQDVLENKKCLLRYIFISWRRLKDAMKTNKYLLGRLSTDFLKKQKSVRSNVFWYIKVCIFWKCIQYTIHWDRTQLSKRFPSDKTNGTKNFLFFLSPAPTHHSFTFNLRFLYDLKHKVRLPL